MAERVVLGLIVDAFAERHEIPATGIRVREHPSPTLVPVPREGATFQDLYPFVRYDLHGGSDGLQQDFETEPFVVALLSRLRARAGDTVPLRSITG